MIITKDYSSMYVNYLSTTPAGCGIAQLVAGARRRPNSWLAEQGIGGLAARRGFRVQTIATRKETS